MLNEFVKFDVLTVSEYASRLGSAVRVVGGGMLEGELQNPRMTPGGMLYFDLTDGEATLPCKVFRREVERMGHQPKNGDLVRIRVDRPDFYVAKGSLSLIVSEITLAGEGELLRLRAELIGRLSREGLCDPARRRPLPSFPRAVGVIAGSGSDGMSDVVKALADRWPAVHIVTCGSAVQGKAAPRQLIDALARFQELSVVDVIVMARGGGSIQDLVCFDDEALCRAVFACEIPVVCAIGHTDNNPVCNHVTWSAHTPSRSAEMVVPSLTEVQQRIERGREVLSGVPARLKLAEERVRSASDRLRAAARLSAHEREISHTTSDITAVVSDFFRNHSSGLVAARTTLATTPRQAAGALAAQQATLASAGTTLAQTDQRLHALAARTAELGDQISVATNRQLTSHAYNYSRAIARVLGEAIAGIERMDRQQRQLLARESDRLDAGVRSRLVDARRAVAHRAALIAAHDFRRRGWLLASKTGKTVRSVADLSAGNRLELQLHDGSVQATVEQVDPQKGPTP